ncbi:hypothetical protein Desti_2616 [Desulfomonile tiedjei DSM 6799]|uniref:DUF2225 domain-containing protein n=1 Tax=Desulfomonile tiedjei (strain ATCC 49306 / DSM 6799 / DCB-1) TaxID=706587 RepID=I4C6V5_DESTA|nr:hypothetical protein Desti_2616 [Desulfomonile tiedjei DSM 6799]
MDLKEDCVNNSVLVVSCPLCMNHFSHCRTVEGMNTSPFGYGLDFRVVPKDCNRSSDVATCPHCHYTSLVQDFHQRVPGHVKELVKSQDYLELFEHESEEEQCARSWLALTSIFRAKGLNPRDLGLLALRGSWFAREIGALDAEEELLTKADRFLDDALRRGLTKGDPGMVIYLLGEINRRKAEFLRGKEMLTFLGNNPRYRYPALLLTVLIEEEDSTPYWSHYAPDQMEQFSPRFKGLFPALRSIPPKKIDYSPDELREQSEQPDDDRQRF